MQKLSVFNLVTLDGYFSGEGGDISWHRRDAEFNKLTEELSGRGSTLLFGRVTYQLMASYWPSAAALQDDPVTAPRMNTAEKVVFSTTLEKADWNNTRLVKSDLLGEVKKLKAGYGKGLMILGSGQIVSQLADESLIDDYQILVNPVVIGKGRTMFDSVKKRLSLKLTNSRIFGNGNVLLTYAPEA